MARGYQFTLSTRQVDAIVANLYAAAARTQRDARRLVADTGERIFSRTYDTCPKDTFFMVEHLRLRFSPDFLVAEVGWDERDFLSAGKAFYALYQELGFRHWITHQFIQNPSLFPARDAELPRFRREMAKIVAAAARRRRAA